MGEIHGQLAICFSQENENAPDKRLKEIPHGIPCHESNDIMGLQHFIDGPKLTTKFLKSFQNFGRTL